MKAVHEALTILLEYVEEPDAAILAEHDEIFCSGPPPNKMKPEHRTKLRKLGFSYDRSRENWQKYV